MASKLALLLFVVTLTSAAAVSNLGHKNGFHSNKNASGNDIRNQTTSNSISGLQQIKERRTQNGSRPSVSLSQSNTTHNISHLRAPERQGAGTSYTSRPFVLLRQNNTASNASQSAASTSEINRNINNRRPPRSLWRRNQTHNGTLHTPRVHPSNGTRPAFLMNHNNSSFNNTFRQNSQAREQNSFSGGKH